MAPRLYIDSLLAEFVGVSTDGVTPQQFKLPDNSIMQWIVDTGNSALKEDAWCIPDICTSPAGIWQGLDRSGQENTLVYAGIPTGSFATDYNMTMGEDFAIPADKVFLVFLSSDFTIAKFRFEDADPENHSFPINSETRFTRRLWP